MKKLELWIARDKDGDIFIYNEKPIKNKNTNCWHPKDELKHPENCNCILLNRNLFPSIKWENKKPTKVKLIITTQ